MSERERYEGKNKKAKPRQAIQDVTVARSTSVRRNALFASPAKLLSSFSSLSLSSSVSHLPHPNITPLTALAHLLWTVTPFSVLCNLAHLPRQFAGSPTGLPGSGGLRPHQTVIMAEEIVIDKTTFFNRLSNLYSTWKTDKRTGNALFDGAGSIVILMGKTDEENSFQKSNAMHVSHRISGRGILCWHIPDC